MIVYSVIIVIFYVITEPTSSFHSKHVINRRIKNELCMEIVPDKQPINELREKLSESNFKDAYQVLKRNPMVPLQNEDAKLLLNNLNSLGSGTNEPEIDQKLVTEASVYIYKRLERQKVLRGFGCVDGEYPEKSIDVTPKKLEELTGLPIKSLTPKERTTYWRLAGICLCLFEYVIGSSVGIDPVYTLLPITFGLLLSDQVLLKGAVFETCYQTLFPEYKKKIVAHEAGHFLIAYLLGLSVRGVVTSAWEARKYPEIRGQAGTMFYDSKLYDELNTQKVTRSSLDRLSIVLMAGIAAEALLFNKAEGGAVDEQSLVNFLASVQPPWNVLRIQGQARWAVLQALLLIKEHRASYDALVAALTEGKGVGDAVIAIEENLPKVLPSGLRITERERRRKKSERDTMLRYVQRMTWNAGGVDEEAASPTPPAERDGKEVVASVVEQAVKTASKEQDSVDAVAIFTEKIRQLEERAREGELDTPPGEGVWLNGLRARQALDGDDVLSAVGGKEVKLPEPLPDYERRLEELVSKEKPVGEETSSAVSLLVADNTSASSLLRKKRGFQVRLLENKEAEKNRKIAAIEERLAAIQREIASTEAAPTTGVRSRW